MKQTILMLLLCVVTLSGKSQDVNVGKIDSLINQIEALNQAAGSIAVFQSGQQVYNRRFGDAQLVGQVASPDAKYRIGSITKLFTATMINQLIEKGELSHETTLNKFFADIPNADKITIKHLLNHTSGLADYVFKDKTQFFWATKPLDQQDIINEIKSQGILFQPGQKVQYSNSGYYLLAKIVEQVFQKPYPQIIQQQIFAPLGMQHTISGVVDHKTIVPSYHLNTHNEWVVTPDFYFLNVIGVGDLVSTPQDLNIFIQALFAGKFLSQQTLESMMPAAKQTFGNGIMVAHFGNRKLYGHDGETFGTRSIVLYDPETKLSISMSINATSVPFNDLLLGMVNRMYDRNDAVADYFIRASYNADPNTYSLYEGYYELENNPSISVKIYRNGADLMADFTGDRPICLEGFKEGVFRISHKKIVIEFQMGANRMIYTQKGKNLTFNKIAVQ